MEPGQFKHFIDGEFVNAGIVFADCDVDAAVEGLGRAAFRNCGQVCLGTERIDVERPIFEKFVAALKARAESLQPGRPEDKTTGLGPLISLEHRRKVLSCYEKARAEGAHIVTGGGVPDMPGELANGSWVQPTIWTGLPESASVVREGGVHSLEFYTELRNVCVKL